MNRFKIFDFKKAACFIPISAILALAGVFVFPAGETQAAPPPPAGWAYRQKITVDHTKVATNLVNFAVLVNLTNASLRSAANGGHVTQSDGGDIRFENSTNAKLGHEIEKYVATNGELVAWVKVDALSSNANTVINMYYGSPDPSKQWNITNTWESSLKMIQHLAETNGAHYDSTSNANNGTPNGAGLNQNVAGKIGGADSFDGTNAYIDCGNAASLNVTNANTIVAWVKVDVIGGVSGGDRVVVSCRRGGAGWNLGGAIESSWLWGAGYSPFWCARVYENAFVGWRVLYGGLGVQTVEGEWAHLAVTYDGTTSRILYQGVTNASSTSLGFMGTAGNLYIGVGNMEWPLQDGYFMGTIDEVRIYNRALSTEEILTLYNNQNSPSTFYSVGPEKYMGSLTMITVY